VERSDEEKKLIIKLRCAQTRVLIYYFIIFINRTLIELIMYWQMLLFLALVQEIIEKKGWSK